VTNPGGTAPHPTAPQTVLLDCDPGIDDALALAFACGDPRLRLAGVTTVSGNVGLGLVTGNALSVLELAGRPDIPVAAGSAVPLLRPVLDARRVHGESGLGGARLPAAAAGPDPRHAVDFLIETIGAAPGEITLVATGPLTNIALALRREPRLAGWVRDFVIMGGSAARGNVTPAAEFNIAADPEAAAIVFGAGWQVTMVGLDVTLQARATPDVQERMRGLGRLGADLLLPGLLGYTGEELPPGPAAGPPVHDVCALALVAEPGLLGCQPARVEVETAGRWTSGMTVTDFAAPALTRNALVALTVDVPAFWDVVLAAYARLPAAQQPPG
jgi:inosine-uridine nucleoside N-ribohydrolase